MTKYYDARAWAVCPYCGHKDCHVFDMVQHPTTILVTCNVEEGGCDKKYAITVSWQAFVEVSSLQHEFSHNSFYAESKLSTEENRQ